jgi:hypothetical protein
LRRRWRRPAHQQAHALAGEFYNAVHDAAVLHFLPALRASLRLDAPATDHEERRLQSWRWW